MDDTSCLILLNFAENYHYVVQDEVQGCHWNKEQCTLHDTSFVFELQRQTCEYIKKALPNVTLLEYFNDGCAGQYKNFKTFLNLCYHSSDFGFVQSGASSLPVMGSHGKSPCDGLGGTVKRLLLRASLQRPVNDQILSFDKVMTFCTTSIKGITFFEISKDDMASVRER